MAYYDYYCEKCEKTFEIKASITDDRSWVKCPDCDGSEIRQLYDGVYIPSKTKTKKAAGGSQSAGDSCSTCSSGNCTTCGM